MECVDESVADAAVDLLNQIHSQLSAAMAGHEADLRRAYVRQCMDLLEAAVAGKDWLRCGRCLAVIERLLETADMQGRML